MKTFLEAINFLIKNNETQILKLAIKDKTHEINNKKDQEPLWVYYLTIIDVSATRKILVGKGIII